MSTHRRWFGDARLTTSTASPVAAVAPVWSMMAIGTAGATYSDTSASPHGRYRHLHAAGLPPGSRAAVSPGERLLPMSVLPSSRPTACANALGTYGPRGLALVAKTAPCAAVNRRGCKLSRSVGCGPDGPVARNRAQQSLN